MCECKIALNPRENLRYDSEKKVWQEIYNGQVLDEIPGDPGDSTQKIWKQFVFRKIGLRVS